MATKKQFLKDQAEAEGIKARVERSLCTVRKKDMAENVPNLKTTAADELHEWANELFSQAGPKGLDEKSSTYDRAVANENFFKDIPIVLKALGTHSFKLPNPDVSTPPIYSDFSGTSEVPPGVLCEFLLPELIVYAGDASKIRLAKFLLAKLVVDGQKSNVLDELIKGQASNITAALIQAGLPTWAVDLANEIRTLREKQNLKSIAIHPLTKQIYFEEEGFEDVILIPVASEKLIAELHHQASQPGRWMASRALCAVGGANPVNGGALCSDLGGAIQVIEAAPPARPDSSVIKRLQQGASLYTKYSISETDTMTFVKLVGLDQTTGNMKKREQEDQAFIWFASILVAPLLTADSFVATGSVSSETNSIGDYLRRNREEPTDSELVYAACAEILVAITASSKSIQNHMSDMQIRSFLLEKMVETIL